MVFDPTMGGAYDAGFIVLFFFFQVGIRNKGKTEGAALAFFGPDPNVTAMRTDDGLCKIQSHARAANLCAVAVVAVEFIEEVADGAFRDADTAILESGFDQAIGSAV